MLFYAKQLNTPCLQKSYVCLNYCLDTPSLAFIKRLSKTQNIGKLSLSKFDIIFCIAERIFVLANKKLQIFLELVWKIREEKNLFLSYLIKH